MLIVLIFFVVAVLLLGLNQKLGRYSTEFVVILVAAALITLVIIHFLTVFSVFDEAIDRTDPTYRGTETEADEQQRPVPSYAEPAANEEQPVYNGSHDQQNIPPATKGANPEQSTTEIQPEAPAKEAVACPPNSRPTRDGGCRLEPTGCHLDEQTPLEECYE